MVAFIKFELLLIDNFMTPIDKTCGSVQKSSMQRPRYLWTNIRLSYLSNFVNGSQVIFLIHVCSFWQECVIFLDAQGRQR